MYFMITKAGALRKRYRARLFGANHELVWYTQTYANKSDAEHAIDLLDTLAKSDRHLVIDNTGKR